MGFLYMNGDSIILPSGAAVTARKCFEPECCTDPSREIYKWAGSEEREVHICRVPDYSQLEDDQERKLRTGLAGLRAS
jgi:hypothetical protein